MSARAQIAVTVLALGLTYALCVAGALEPETAAQLAAEHRAALEAESRLRYWQCPHCFVTRVQELAPEGWLIVEPFTRVAACSVCR